MINLYVRRIQAELMTIEQVPSLWRERVRERLAELASPAAE